MRSLLVALVLSSLVASACVAERPSSAVAAEAATRIAVDVEGLGCNACAAAVREAVAEVPGVATVEVDVATGRVTVGLDPSRTDAAKVVAAIDGLGYRARVAATPAP